jgi:hypothetical protein
MPWLIDIIEQIVTKEALAQQTGAKRGATQQRPQGQRKEGRRGNQLGLHGWIKMGIQTQRVPCIYTDWKHEREALPHMEVWRPRNGSEKDG